MQVKRSNIAQLWPVPDEGILIITNSSDSFPVCDTVNYESEEKESVR